MSALLTRLHEADAAVHGSITPALPAIARAAEALAARLSAGGRVLYVGAGTSGRLAALDAAELPPTFGTDPSRVKALMAGGPKALLVAVEGAEDDEAAAAADLSSEALSPGDAVVGIAASGRTPYVLAAVREARRLGAFTVGLATTPETPLLAETDIGILADVGPEVLTGSTRLKAGTATKMILNLLSTAVMDELGLLVEVPGENRWEMAAMRPTNAKLRLRAARIVKELVAVPGPRAGELLESAGWELPVALAMGRFDESAEAARARLARAHGNVREAIFGKGTP
ncbi:MAG: N-acetylmuramic acid 6-phosphate etherase [Acidobacteria bacterium]|nr:N-acetylmuramic acid 6-phosphate etherase [Acidobacteriota bacterium]